MLQLEHTHCLLHCNENIEEIYYNEYLVSSFSLNT